MLTARLAFWLTRYRYPLIASVGVLTLVAGVLASGIRYDFTPQALFRGENDLVAFSKQTKQTFGHAENVVLVILQACQESDVLSAESLAWQRKATRVLQAADSVVGVEALTTVKIPRPRLGARRDQQLSYIPIVRDVELDTEELELVRAKVDDQQLLTGTLISADRRFLAMVLRLDPTNKEIDHVEQVILEVQQRLVNTPPPNGYKVFLSGLPALRVAMVGGLKNDQATIIPLCALVFGLVQVTLFRSWTGVLISAVAIVAGLTWTIASLVLLDESLTIISNILPVLLMIVGMSSCVHFLNGYLEKLALTPANSELAVRRTVEQIAVACLLTSLTTALGFLSLLAARSVLLSSLGWQAALGMGFMFLATVLVCSCLLSFYRPMGLIADHSQSRDDTLKRKSVVNSPLARFAWLLGRIGLRHSWLTLGAGLAVLFAAAWLGSSAVVNSRLLETFDSDHPQTQQMRLVEKHLGGFVPMEIVLKSDEAEWYLQAAEWRELTGLIGRIQQQEEVLKVRSLVDLIEDVDRQLPAGPQLPQLLKDPGSTAKLSSRLGEANEALSRPPAARVLRRFSAIDGRQLRIQLYLQDSGTRGTLALAKRLEGLLAASYPSDRGITFRITGESYLAAVALTSFIRDLLYSLLGVSALIFIVIGLVLQSPRLGLISILPNVTPLVVTLGYIQLRGYEISMSNVIVFAISLGVAVDDTIHFLARFRDETRTQGYLSDGGVDGAVRRTCLGTGRAVVVTTILIVSGMALLLLSAFVPTRRFAELAGVTMVSALLADLLLLPAVLKICWPKSRSAVVDQTKVDA